MAIPSGYSLLGRIGYNDRGVYTESSDYVRGDVVYHEGSSYVALATVTGVTPADDNTNWKYLARGFGTTELSEIDATDTSGFAGVVGKKVKGQTLIDKIAEYVMSKVVATDAFQTYLQKFLVDNCVTERSDLSLSAAQGKALMDLYTQLYSDLGKIIGTPYIRANSETTTFTMPYTCMCLVLQYGKGNFSDTNTLTLDGADILSKATASIKYDEKGYLRIIPVKANKGSVFKITSDTASIIF